MRDVAGLKVFDGSDDTRLVLDGPVPDGLTVSIEQGKGKLGTFVLGAVELTTGDVVDLIALLVGVSTQRADQGDSDA